jgi:hypothetical protein
MLPPGNQQHPKWQFSGQLYRHPEHIRGPKKSGSRIPDSSRRVSAFKAECGITTPLWRQFMKKLSSVLLISLIAITLHAQNTQASGTAHAAANAKTTVSQQVTQANANQAASSATRAGQSSAQATEATHLSAELTRRVDTRHAKIGDKVFAKTTSKTQLANGIRLPRGTHLIGRVTSVQARSRANHTARLAFTFDRAVLRHGRTIPIHAVLTSISAPSAMAAANSMDDMNAGPMGAGGMAGGSAMAAPAPAGGGMVGGGMVGGALHSVGNVAGHGAAMAGNNIDAAGRMGAGMANATTASAMGNATVGEHAMSGLNGATVPVAHLPSVMMTSSSSSGTSGTLTSNRRNFSLESGTQMMMNVSASPSGASGNGSAAASAHGSAQHPSQRKQ